ncbi:MAG TPA: exodeoxyribonuclease VII large subunit, partial [Beijerinckiaceae bacterium]|nr:exodeoxyribonuclease VII large subunit [Beijerinckiaceae bacterium]
LPGPEALLAGPRQRLDVTSLKLSGAVRSGVERRNGLIGVLARRLAAQAPQARLARFAERISGLGALLERSLARRTELRRQRLDAVGKSLAVAFAARLAGERRDMLRRRERLVALAERLPRALGMRQADRAARLHRLDSLLGSLGYRQVLARGFALVRDGDGKAVRHAAAVSEGMALRIEFADGEVATTAGEGARPKSRAKQPAAPSGGQGSLF